jgi:tetratricopeptide (TPR) repeat protein
MAQDTVQLPEAVINAKYALDTARPAARFQLGLDLATAYRKAEMTDSAKAVAERLLRDARTDGERGHAHFAMARVLFDLHNYDGVQDNARQAILLARAAGDTAAWIRGAEILCEVDMGLDRFAAVKERDGQILALAMATNDSVALSNVYNNLANIHYLHHDLDSAHWYYDKAIAIMPVRKKNDRLVIQLNQVNIFIEEERYDLALARSDAIRSGVQAGGALLRAHYFNQRGYAFYSMGRYRDAITEFERSDSVNNTEVKALDLRIENTGFLADSHAALGDSAQAYLLMVDLEALKDSFNRQATDERMLQLEKQFQTRLSKEEIQRLDNENRQKAARLRAKDLELFGSLALALLALGAVWLVWRNLRQKREHATVLEKLNAELKDRKERIEEINRLLQLKVLRTQMNPHFIYNSLNAIHNMVRKGDSVAASAYLDGFARLLRMVLDHSVKEHVPLEDEIAFLRQYLKMEAMRFEDGLDHAVDADRELLDDDHLVPTLIVQPFVENAIWHGLAPKQGEKRLRIHFRQRDGKIVCTVEDNGVGRDAAPKRDHPDGSASVGLQLTNERLQLLAYTFGGKGRIVFTDLKEGLLPVGTRVEVTLTEG